MTATLGLFALVGVAFLVAAALLVKSMLPLARDSLLSPKALLAVMWIVIGLGLIYSAVLLFRVGIF